MQECPDEPFSAATTEGRAHVLSDNDDIAIFHARGPNEHLDNAQRHNVNARAVYCPRLFVNDAQHNIM